jgi:cytochrome bd-type quinol oxidase subunit 1
MITANYSLGSLWPEFSRLITGDFTSPEGLSAIFVAALFLLASIFVFWCLIKYFQG